MVNKKALWKIMEAVFAVAIILSALIFLSVKQEIKDRNEFFHLLRPALNEIAHNQELRDKIIADDDTGDVAEEMVLNEVRAKINSANLQYKIFICEISSGSCGNVDIEGEIYSEERIISSSLTEFRPKIVKLFVWRN